MRLGKCQHGILIDYEIRTKHKNPTKREENFTTYKKTRKNKQQLKISPSCSYRKILDYPTL